VIGSIERNPFGKESKFGFYPSDIELWITVLCKECGIAVHHFIASQLQMEYLRKKISKS